MADMMDGPTWTLHVGRCAAVKYTNGTTYNRRDKVGLKSVSVISVRVICGPIASRSCKPECATGEGMRRTSPPSREIKRQEREKEIYKPDTTAWFGPPDVTEVEEK